MHTLCKRVVPFGYWLSAIHGLPLACRAELGPGRGLAYCSVLLGISLQRLMVYHRRVVQSWALAGV